MKFVWTQIKRTLPLALLMLVAAWLGQSTANGYLHGADIFILLACVILPTPHAAVAAGLTGALADCLKGYSGLALLTLVIKVLMVLLGKALLKTALGKKYPEIAVAPAALVPVAGYFLYKLVFHLIIGEGLGAFAIAAGTLQKDLIQAGASFLLFVFIYDLYMGIRAAKESTAPKE